MAEKYPLKILLLGNDEDGIVGIVSKGHHDLDAFLQAMAVEKPGQDLGIHPARHFYCRVIPFREDYDCTSYWMEVDQPGPGAFPVTGAIW